MICLSCGAVMALEGKLWIPGVILAFMAVGYIAQNSKAIWWVYRFSPCRFHAEHQQRWLAHEREDPPEVTKVKSESIDR